MSRLSDAGSCVGKYGSSAVPGDGIVNLYASAFQAAMRDAGRFTRRKEEEMTMAPHGHFHWNELLTKDPERAKHFYRETIGWTFEGMPMDDGGTYWVAWFDKLPAGGIFSTARPGFESVPESWMSYLSVDDVDSRVAKATTVGARLMRPIFDIPNVGRIAILAEPGGAGIGWITPTS